MAKKLKLTANNSSTMYDLAKVFGTTIDELKKYNKLNSNVLKSGQELFWETDDVEGVKKRLSDLQNYRQAKYEKDKAEYDRVQAAKAKSAQSFKDLHANDEDYGDMTQHQINDYQNFKKQGLGNSIQDFKAYKEREHKSAESTRDLTKKAGYGIIGAAAAMPLLANPAGLARLVQSPVGSIARSIAGSEVARESAKKAGLNESYQTAASYLGGGFAGLSKSLLQNGIRSTVVEGLSSSAGLAAADQTNKALEGTSNYVKYPMSMIAGFFGRRGFNSGVRNSIKNTKWGENLITQNKNNSASAFSSQGHVQPRSENPQQILNTWNKNLKDATGSENILKRGFAKIASEPFDKTVNSNIGNKILTRGIDGTIYTGAQAMKALPMVGTGLGVAGAQDVVDNYTDNELVKESMNYIMPFLTNKMFGTYQNFNKGNAQFLTYASGGTGKGMKSAIQNTAKIALGKPKSVNNEQKSAQLSKPELAKGLSIAAWDALPIHYNNGKFGRNYKPGGYGFMYYTTKGNQGGDWGNLNASGYVGHNPITHMYSGAPLGVGMQSSGQHVRLGNSKNNLIDNIAQRLFPKGSGYDTRYGDRPIEVTFAGNKVDLSRGKWAKSFDKHGNVTEWTTNPSEASVRHTNYNVDTGHRTSLNNKTQNLTVNTKGQQTMVWQDPDGNTFSIGGDLYGVGSGKTGLLSSMYGAYMDAHANPIITLSANKYTPTKTKGTQSFGSEVYSNLPHYRKGGKLLGVKSYGL